MKHIQKGFTLVELLLYMALLGLFLLVMTDVLVTVLESQAESAATSLVDIDSRFILSRLAYDIGQATAITIPAATGQTATSLGLSSGTYSLSGTNLVFTGVQLNSFDSQVSKFLVTRVGNGTNKDTVIISIRITSGSLSRDYTTTLGLR